MLLQIVLATLIAVKTTCGDIVVHPSGNPVYFSVGMPANISCTAQVLSGNVEDSIAVVRLVNGTDARTALPCSTSRRSASFEYLFPSSFGNVSLSRSYPQQSAVNCTYTLPTISDGTYSCIATYLRLPAEVKSFDVITTKQPGVFINNVNQAKIAAMEGSSINVTCVAINSKPAYSLSWTPLDFANAETSSTSQATINGYTNSTTSLILVAAASMNGRMLTCNASSPTPSLGSRSATALFNIYYGPIDSEGSAVSAQASVITIECSLLSNPPIQSYTWLHENNPFNCTTRSCNVSYSGHIFSIFVCRGRNPTTGREGLRNITVKWSSVVSASSLRTELKTNVALAIGLAVGVAALVAIAVVSAILVKKKRALSRSAPNTNDKETNQKKTMHSINRSSEEMQDKVHDHPVQREEKLCDDSRATQNAFSGQAVHSPAVGRIKSQHNPSGGKSAIKSKKNLRCGTSQLSRR